MKNKTDEFTSSINPELPSDDDGIELTEKYIVLGIPEDTVSVEINAKVFHNGGLINVSKTMDFAEVRKMFKEAEDGYIPSDATFVVTEKGREFLRQFEEAGYAD